ncbi:hypothetical protein B0H67DRAFT_53738 [Lasiosphaeris hirsuta]|uniref:Uncharacterized protein n=1 Tax=Lasiosphaeris hirsuta TaxID=260670 RepID=A0AA40BBA8_9PEZI|nr:hypothetical protein B0H67DRAFT_53738 [Lasiosphaeris hirsuta]
MLIGWHISYFYPLLVKGLGYTNFIMALPVFNLTARFILLVFITAGLWLNSSQVLAYISDIMGAVRPDISNWKPNKVNNCRFSGWCSRSAAETFARRE